MSDEVITILVLVAIFLVATLLSINMGVLGLVAAYVVGRALGLTDDDIFAGFPGDLFIVLVGVTYLFAIAKNNGTVDWLVYAAVRAVGGRTALIPWVMFGVTAILTAVGSVVPAAVAIIAPIGLGFAVRYRINPVLMGLLIINGATARRVLADQRVRDDRQRRVGAQRPRGQPDAAVRRVVRLQPRAQPDRVRALRRPRAAGPRPRVDRAWRRGRARGRRLGSGRAPVAGGSDDAAASDEDAAVQGLDRDRILTLIGILVLCIGALAFELDVGFVALCVAAVLSVISPSVTKGAVSQVAWPTVLLICGVVTYVSVLEEVGTIEFLGEEVADLGAPLLSALLICYIGAAVSAFASTTGILGALIPLAVPFLLEGTVGAVGLIIALAISSSVVDSSPFSTSGALVVANSPDDRRDFVFRRLMQWGMSMVALAPPVVWLILVVPGWL